jgi:hypothetical protein
MIWPNDFWISADLSNVPMGVERICWVVAISVMTTILNIS